MSRFGFHPTSIAGVVSVQRQAALDARGFFSRLYCADEFAGAGFTKPVAQMNHTLTRRAGAVRGLHFQNPPHAEAKVVSCLRGEIWDVAVDLRADSPTFLHWHAEVLSAANLRSLVIPEGCAHGFQALTDDCELLYLHSAAYQPSAEAALHVADPRLAIAWPLAMTDLSDRDRNHAMIDQNFQGVAL